MSLKTLLSRPLFLAVTSTCPFCHRARQLAASKGIEPALLILDQDPNGNALRRKLTELTGQRTVPYAFSNGKFIGGYDELSEEPASFWSNIEK